MYKIYTHEKPKGRRTFCGPTVLMLLTGKDREVIEAAINRYRNKRYREMTHVDIAPNKLTDQVKGMYPQELFVMLEKFKFKPVRERQRPNMTLKTFVDDVQYSKHPYVVVLNNHFVLVYQNKVYDTRARQGCDAKDHPNARKQVMEYFLINKGTRK